jgi:hypothetical protein
VTHCRLDVGLRVKGFWVLGLGFPDKYNLLMHSMVHVVQSDTIPIGSARWRSTKNARLTLNDYQYPHCRRFKFNHL